MNFVKNIFWNDAEKRLRLVWRLSFQALLMLILLFISELLLSLSNIYIFKQPVSADPAGDLSGSSPFLLLTAYLIRGLFLSLSVWIAGRVFDRRPFSDFGFRITTLWWRDFWFGIGLGALLMTAIFLLELAAGWITPTGYFVSHFPELPFMAAISIPLLLFIAVGFYEELFSRGYQLTNLAEGFSGKYLSPQVALLLACLISSGFFGFLHATNPNATLLSSLNIGLAGIFLATGFLLTGELAVPIGLHISWNFFQGNIFGFPVSGGNFKSAALVQIQQNGPDWLTGGAFGPEGGLIGAFANILGILLIIFWVKNRTGKVSLHAAISSPPIPRPREKPDKRELVNQVNTSIFQGIQHIIWDWNGTLLDDLDICLAVINGMLKNRGLNSITRSGYLDIFGFPVKDYYLELGFDFSQEPFEEISTEFITSYEQGRQSCSLMEGTIDLLKLINNKGIDQSILSASKKSYLDQAVIEYKIKDFFSLVDGLDNHHAAGKLSLARDHIEKINLDPQSILLIGDTLHDAEIAHELGLRCCLIPNGHHSKKRLELSGASLVGSLVELKNIFQSTA